MTDVREEIANAEDTAQTAMGRAAVKTELTLESMPQFCREAKSDAVIP